MKLGQLKNHFSSSQKIRLTEYGETIFEGMCDDCNGFDNMTVGLIEPDYKDYARIRINVYKRHKYN